MIFRLDGVKTELQLISLFLRVDCSETPFSRSRNVGFAIAKRGNKDWADTNSRAERQQKPKKASARLLESNEYAEGGEDSYENIAPRKSAGETKLSTKISTRNTLASVDSIVRRFLGKELERTGKAAVIDAALEASSSSDGVPEYNVSFNKYSGICEWQNDAIFLWVNIGSPHADVVNEFVDGGQRMTWFGGSRMHDGTPSIRNLIRVGRKARDGNLTKEDGIILWVRQYLPERRNFTPYVCLGRCSYGNHVAGTKPMEFVLNILDCDALKKREKKTGTFFFLLSRHDCWQLEEIIRKSFDIRWR